MFHNNNETLLCYCQGHCPSALSFGICETEMGGKCFSSVESGFEESGKEYRYFTHGCLTSNNTIQFMHPFSISHGGTKYVRYCTSSNYCNKPSLFPPDTYENVDIFNKIVITCLILSIIISLVIVTILIVLNCRRLLKSNYSNEELNGNNSRKDSFQTDKLNAKIWITNLMLRFGLLAINVYKTARENIVKFMLRIKIQKSEAQTGKRIVDCDYEHV